MGGWGGGWVKEEICQSAGLLSGFLRVAGIKIK